MFQQEEINFPLILLISTFCLIMFVVSILVLFRAYQVRKINHIKERQYLQHALLQTQIEIQEQTLKTISQEIHDNVGQVLSLAKLNLNTLEMAGGNREQKIESSIQLVSKAINDLRQLSRSLSGSKIADLGLQDATDNELKIIANTGQFATELIISGEPYFLQPQHEMVMFRIVQESLNNALKHSKAKNIFIEMHYEAAAFSIAINDNGAGFDADQLQATETGIGLINMRNRASLIGARFSINSNPGAGTSILIQLPQPII